MFLNKEEFVAAMEILAETQTGGTEIKYSTYKDKRKLYYDLYITEASSKTISALMSKGYELDVYGGTLRIQKEHADD